MTQTTASQCPAPDTRSAAYRRSVTALDSVNELLHAHTAGQYLGDTARVGISRALSEVLRDLGGLEATAEPGSDEALRAREGLRRFDSLLGQIAEAGLLPER
jgi:hypothetical protein